MIEIEKKKMGRPYKSEKLMDDRLYIRVSKTEKEEITQFSKENGYSLLELIRIGIEKVKEKK